MIDPNRLSDTFQYLDGRIAGVEAACMALSRSGALTAPGATPVLEALRHMKEMKGADESEMFKKGFDESLDRIIALPPSSEDSAS